MKKALRPLSLILALVFSFTIFCISGSAAVVTDIPLNFWTNVYPDSTKVSLIGPFDSAEVIYHINIKPELIGDSSMGLRTALIYSVAGLEAGSSYSFNFHLLSYEECNDSISDANFTSKYYDFFTKRNATIIIGIGSVSSSGEFTFGDTGVVITKDNYLDFFGTDSSFTFVLPNIANPAIGIYYFDTTDSGNATNLYLKRVYLYNNTLKAQKDLEDAVEDVSDSVDSLKDSLLGSLSDLKDSFSSDLTDLKDGIGSFFTELKESISSGLTDLKDNLLSGFDDIITRFGNLFLYLTWDDTPPDNPFESVDGPLDAVGDFFDELFDYLNNMKNDLVSVIDSVSSGLHVFVLFIDRFAWLKGLCVFCLALIVATRFIGL